MTDKKVPQRWGMGRPPIYREEFCDKILNDPKCKGKDLIQIARELGVTRQTLYDWEKTHANFSYSLQRAREAKQAALLDDYDTYKITEKGERFADNAMIKLLSMAGYNRHLPEMKGVTDELEAIQIVQDALADGRVSESFAEKSTTLLRNKLEVKKILSMGEEMQEVMKRHEIK